MIINLQLLRNIIKIIIFKLNGVILKNKNKIKNYLLRSLPFKKPRLKFKLVIVSEEPSEPVGLEGLPQGLDPDEDGISTIEEEDSATFEGLGNLWLQALLISSIGSNTLGLVWLSTIWINSVPFPVEKLL